MAEELLVGEQLTPEMIKSGAMLVHALDKLNVLVTGALWLLDPQERVWRLVIASPEVRLHGPKALYRKVQTAVARLPDGVAPVGTKDVSVVDDRHPLVALLRTALSTGKTVSNIRFSRSVINGTEIEDAYLYRVA